MTVTVYRSDDASAPSLTGTAGSLITVLDAILVNGYGAKSAAGFAKEFTGTNLAVYRAATGNRFRMRLDDTNTQEGRVVLYETMSDVNTGTNPTPSAAQVSGGLFVRKSNTADATVRPWVAVSNGTCFYFFPFSSDTALSATPTATGTSGHLFFGDFTSYKSGDAYGSIILTAGATGNSLGRMGSVTVSTTLSTALVGHYIPRSYPQIGTSTPAAKRVPGDWTSTTTMGTTGLPAYPDFVTGGIPLNPVEIWETGVTRGKMPGMWAPLVANPANNLDTVTGSGDLAGKTFMILYSYDAASIGRLLIETSNTW